MKFMSFGIALVFLLSAVLPGFAQTGEPVPPPGDGDDLAAQLKLTGEQVTRAEKIFEVAQSQAESDRENFKGNALGLIQAARRRREMTDTHIETMLDPAQKELFEEFKRARGRDEELFMLKEGLLLTPEQVVQVEQILDSIRKEFDAKRGKGRGPMGDMDGGMRGGPPGDMGGMNGRMPGGGMRGGGPGGMHGEKDSKMMDAMKQQDDKKAKQIKTLLTKEQKEMYKDIRKLQKTEMKQRMEQMHERRRPEMNR